MSVKIPTEFKKIIIDMTKDILVSFPEQEQNLHKELKNLVFEDDKTRLDNSLEFVYLHCKTFYPVKFFDILYQNNIIFENDESEFLPGINFKALWKENISDKTRETLWKYLQLVLFTIVSSISDENSDGNTFGDTAKLFEAINENEFKTKLEETIAQMQTLFGESKGGTDDHTDNGEEGDTSNSTESKSAGGINLDDLPNPADIHEHVTNMMNGKLGKLAREIAEETAADLNLNTENAESINDVFKRLIHNPAKLLGLVKNVGSKLDEKIKTGDMKESELLEEASELMKKMKNMPGMGDLQSMLSKMGMNMGKGSGKVNVDAMQSNLNQRLKESKNRERLLKKLYEKKNAAASAQREKAQEAQAQPIENLVFSKGEKVERSTREQSGTQPGTQPDTQPGAQPNTITGEKKKKKNKK
jgi:hypothetical protein